MELSMANIISIISICFSLAALTYSIVLVFFQRRMHGKFEKEFDRKIWG